MNRLRKSKSFRRFLVSWLPDFLLIFSCVPVFLINSSSAAESIVIGSKKFTESYVLGEIAKRILTDAGISAEHRQGMGGTIILWEGLRGGQIDAYPEYTGTIATEILKSDLKAPEIRAALEKFGVGMTAPLGFNNTYALVMQRSEAQRLGIRTISDLQRYPELKFGLTHEFLERQDGWRPLRQRYGLPQQNIVGIDHALGYGALVNGSIAVKDAYSTDAKIEQNDLFVLEDDLHFFPKYEAVFLFRSSTRADAITALRGLEGTLDETRMIRLNAEAERTKNYARAADLYSEGRDGALRRPDAAARRTYQNLDDSFWHKLARWTLRHLQLAGFSLLLAIIVGIPLGIVASRGGVVGHVILGFAGVVQTIPSLALLALLVPLPFFGISIRTAIAALFLYGLLPIVRNTATGLQDIPRSLRESAVALGLSPTARLWQVYLPIASRSILSGIKTSAVINIGTATLAALIGAGGLGEPIISGLNLNDHVTILEGAIPAAVLALLVQWCFDLLDRVLIPKGLRI